jgi:hypothetical protein
VSRLVSALLCALALSGCGTMQLYRVEVCDTLFFGTARANAAPVNDAEWQQFLDREIATRFPDGFTTWDATGQWRTATGDVQRERTHLVLLVHPNGTGETKIAEIIETYKRTFAQEAVFRTRGDCGVQVR